MYCICLDAEERLLPAECQAVAVAGPDGTLVVQQMSRARRRSGPAGVRQRPPGPSCVARSIAPVRDVSGEDEADGLPAACRLLDVLGLEPPDAQAIAARWNAGGRSTRAVIGDVLRRAVRHRPAQGRAARADRGHHRGGQVGAAADADRVAGLCEPAGCDDVRAGGLQGRQRVRQDCVHLPHVTGMVTDLDAHLTQRALASLSAELTRREKILAAAGAKDIDDYTALGRARERRSIRCPGWSS